MIFAIFVYEMSYVANSSEEINENLKRKEMAEFNAQFEVYANKEPGYLEIKNAISVQEFATLCNLVRQWNSENLSDIIELIVNSGPEKNKIQEYAKQNSREALEDLFEYLNCRGGMQNYYFLLEATDMGYSDETGRVNRIKLEVKKL